MRFAILAATSCALILGLSACASGRAKPGDRPRPTGADARDAAATMSVENRNWQDVVIYAIHDGTRTRLGTVTAATTASFFLKSLVVHAGSELQFVAHAIGERRMFASERVLVQPGQHVEWLLESGLERSSLTVR